MDSYDISACRQHSALRSRGSGFFQMKYAVVLLFVVSVLAGCGAGPPWLEVEAAGPTASTDVAAEENPALDSSLPQAVVVTGDVTANIRSGPGLAFPLVGSAAPGTSFRVVGKTDDEAWWQVCCIQDGVDGSDGEANLGWMADIVVNVDGDTGALPVISPLLPDQLEATWTVDWICGSDRCDAKACTATADAQAIGVADQRWLSIDHSVTWDDACHPNEAWTSELDRYTGKERSGVSTAQFLHSYWLGLEPGEANDVRILDDDRRISVWCSDSQNIEVDEGGGWTTVHTGYSCYDVGTGILAYRSYTKRWLYSGAHEGKEYDRAYFVDYETLEQRLHETNLALSYIE